MRQLSSEAFSDRVSASDSQNQLDQTDRQVQNAYIDNATTKDSNMTNQATETTTMSAKVINVLIKRGHSKETAEGAVAKNLDWAMRGYSGAKASFLADVCISDY